MIHEAEIKLGVGTFSVRGGSLFQMLTQCYDSKRLPCATWSMDFSDGAKNDDKVTAQPAEFEVRCDWTWRILKTETNLWCRWSKASLIPLLQIQYPSSLSNPVIFYLSLNVQTDIQTSLERSWRLDGTSKF